MEVLRAAWSILNSPMILSVILPFLLVPTFTGVYSSIGTVSLSLNALGKLFSVFSRSSSKSSVDCASSLSASEKVVLSGCAKGGFGELLFFT